MAHILVQKDINMMVYVNLSHSSKSAAGAGAGGAAGAGFRRAHLDII